MAVSEVTTLAEIETSEFIPSLWSLKVQAFLEDALVIVPLVDHRYEEDLTYGQTLHVPNYVEITATTVVPGTEITPKEPEGTTLEILVDKWYEAPISYSEFSRVQNRPDFLESASSGSAYAVAKQMDLSLANLFDGFQADATPQGSDGNTVTDDLLIDCMEILDEYSVRQEGRVIIGDPSMKADLMKIDKFIRNDYGKGGVVASGKFGDIYNCTVWITNNLEEASTGHEAAMMQKEALAIITQKQPTVQRFDMPWKHMHLIQVQAMWGVKEMRDRAGVCFYTRKL